MRESTLPILAAPQRVGSMLGAGGTCEFKAPAE
jgi:hypothetical protein